MSGKLKASTSGIVGAGIGLEIGKQILQGLETAFSTVVNVIPGMINKGQEFALTVHDLSVKTGASAETASRFAGTLQYLGVRTEGLGMSLKTLSQNLVKSEGAMNKLGIATRDANKMPLDTITILDNLRHYLSQTADGYTKLGLAGKELGRSAGNLIEYFNLTDEQAAFLNNMLDNLAVTMGGDAVQASEGLRREENLLGLAWQGLSETLAQAVVPALRQVIGGIIEFVSTHGPQLRQMLADITNSVLGFATALLGVENVTPFQMQMDALGGSTSKTALSFEQWTQQMGYTIPKVTAATGATKAGTAAIDKQVAALTALDKQQDRTYKRGLDALNAQLDAQLKLFDAQDQKISRAQRDLDLQRGLRDAQEALDRAQLEASKATDPAAQLDAARSVRDAEESLAQARQAIADESRTRAEEDRKGQIEAVKTYLADVDKLVSDADNRQANLTALQGREKGLKAAGPAAPGSDRAIELQAVLAAEQRIRDAMANTAKQSALAKAKEEAQAVGNVQVDENAKALAKMNKQYQTSRDQQKIAHDIWVSSLAHSLLGDPKTGTGLGGAMSSAFAQGQKAGEAFQTFLVDRLVPAVQGLFDLLTKVGGMFAADAAALDWLTHPNITTEGVWGPDIANMIKRLFPAYPDTVPGNRASGGPVAANVPYIVNEHTSRSEFFMADVPGRILTGAPTFVGESFGGQPAIIRLEIGGRPLLDYVDQNLAYRGVRRT